MSSNLHNVLSCYNSSRARFELFIDEKVDGERFPSPGNPSPSLLSILTFTLLTCIIALALLFYWVFLPIRTQCWTSCLQPILKRFCPLELSFRLIIIIIISIIIKIITITIITIIVINIVIITIVIITIIIIVIIIVIIIITIILKYLSISNCAALPPAGSLVQLPVGNNPEADAALVLNLRKIYCYL